MILEKGEMESKKYIVVKNHVREIVENDNTNDTNANTEDVSKKTNKRSKKNKNNKKEESSSEEENVASEISENDIQELLSAYNNCKTIITKIETKYGHLLNLDCEGNRYNRKRKNELKECNCTSNKKIIFDENGQRLQESNYRLQNHICSNKRLPYQDYVEGKQHLQVENECDYDLPSNLCELGEMLKDTSIHRSLRNRIIEQIKYIKQENLNIIRFEKQLLVQQLKSNANEFFDFNGSNLSSLQGYPE